LVGPSLSRELAWWWIISVLLAFIVCFVSASETGLAALRGCRLLLKRANPGFPARHFPGPDG